MSRQYAMNYSMTIVYRATSDAHFDWEYYVRKHLPLAVGTSMRHSAIAGCDCDRPLYPADSPIAAICNVHFADRPALEDFCTFFASGHEESRDIIADEPNYTSITPAFVATACNKDDDARTTGYRVRLLLPPPRDPSSAEKREGAASDKALRVYLQAAHPGVPVATAVATGSIPLDLSPVYDTIWTTMFGTRWAATDFAAQINSPATQTQWRRSAESLCRVEVVPTEVIPFELASAVAVRDAGQSRA